MVILREARAGITASEVTIHTQLILYPPANFFCTQRSRKPIKVTIDRTAHPILYPRQSHYGNSAESAMSPTNHKTSTNVLNTSVIAKPRLPFPHHLGNFLNHYPSGIIAQLPQKKKNIQRRTAAEIGAEIGYGTKKAHLMRSSGNVIRPQLLNCQAKLKHALICQTTYAHGD